MTFGVTMSRNQPFSPVLSKQSLGSSQPGGAGNGIGKRNKPVVHYQREMHQVLAVRLIEIRRVVSGSW